MFSQTVSMRWTPTESAHLGEFLGKIYKPPWVSSLALVFYYGIPIAGAALGAAVGLALTQYRGLEMLAVFQLYLVPIILGLLAYSGCSILGQKAFAWVCRRYTVSPVRPRMITQQWQLDDTGLTFKSPSIEMVLPWSAIEATFYWRDRLVVLGEDNSGRILGLEANFGDRDRQQLIAFAESRMVERAVELSQIAKALHERETKGRRKEHHA